MGPLQAILLFASAGLFFLAAAKTHGRQIRLERELVGIDEVDFRRDVLNHPWVEELWRRDRVGYWIRAFLLFLPLLAMLSFLAAEGRFEWWAVVPISILFAMGFGFAQQAFRSQWRLRAMLQSGAGPELGPRPRHDDPVWKRHARRGSLVWFGATWVLSIAAVASLVSVLMT